MPITYLVGDATAPQIDRPYLIAHVVNDIGVFNAGFAKAMAKRWPHSKEAYLEWFRGGHARWAKEPFELGSVQFVSLAEDLGVANMVAQRSVGMKDGPPIRYEALEKCLKRVAHAAAKLEWVTVMPRIGSGLSGGSWAKVEPLILKAFGDQLVFVYDYPGIQDLPGSTFNS